MDDNLLQPLVSAGLALDDQAGVRLELEEPFVCYLVVHDADLRASLQCLLHANRWTVESFQSPRLFLDAIEPAARGCIFTTIRLPECGGLRLLDLLHDKDIHLPVIFFSNYPETDVQAAVNLLKKGVHDIQSLPLQSESVLASVNAAMNVERQARQKRKIHARVSALMAALTGRELEVIERVAQGLSNKLIADQLHLSPKTVEFHRARGLKKLAVKNVAELVNLLMIRQ